MNKYELIYIIDASLEDESRKELVDRFSEIIKSNGGEIEKIDEWGKRRLAYTIDYKTEGYYVLVHYEADGEVPKEVERNLEINDNIIRYLTVKIEEKTSKVKPRSARKPAYQSPRYNLRDNTNEQKEATQSPVNNEVKVEVNVVDAKDATDAETQEQSTQE